MLGAEGGFLIECLRAQTLRTKTPVLAVIFRVLMTSVSPYQNPHISAELWRMKTTKQPYFILTSREFTFRSQFFFFHLHIRIHDGVMVTSPEEAPSGSRIWILKIFLRPANRI